MSQGYTPSSGKNEATSVQLVSLEFSHSQHTWIWWLAVVDSTMGYGTTDGCSGYMDLVVGGVALIQECLSAP